MRQVGHARAVAVVERQHSDADTVAVRRHSDAHRRRAGEAQFTAALGLQAPLPVLHLRRVRPGPRASEARRAASCQLTSDVFEAC